MIRRNVPPDVLELYSRIPKLTHEERIQRINGTLVSIFSDTDIRSQIKEKQIPIVFAMAQVPESHSFYRALSYGHWKQNLFGELKKYSPDLHVVSSSPGNEVQLTHVFEGMLYPGKNHDPSITPVAELMYLAGIFSDNYIRRTLAESMLRVAEDC
jgi:hypothetical protein